jgi:ferric-dicitrate binding protein FerR (iron transport regulator)
MLYVADRQADTSIVLTADGQRQPVTQHATPLTTHHSPLTAHHSQAPFPIIAIDATQPSLTVPDLSRQPVRRQTLQVPPGRVARIDLPDGSRVWLNTHSSIVYPDRFLDGHPRQVQLVGEAYFEVAPDATKPFIVECGGVTTYVLGTQFNICAYDGQRPQITLVQGSVNVQSATSDVTLTPGQTATLGSGGRLSVAAADVRAATCWRDGLFYFDGQTLRDIMVELGRWYNMNVIATNTAHIDDRLHFSGERQWTIYELIRQMNMICNTNIAIEGDTLLIY